MLEIIVLKGIPASGKSTWAKEIVKLKGKSQYKRINKDDLRAMLDCSTWSPDNEKFVTNLRDYITIQCLNKGISVIIDDTNLHSKHEHRMYDIAQHYANTSGKNIQFQVKWFHIDKKEAIERDSKRVAKVGEKVIEDMYKKYQSEKNKTDSHVVLYPTYSGIEQDENLPKAVIVDIDGTLAHMTGRGPFEWDKVIYDEPKMPIINLVQALIDSGDYKIIFFSGRDSICREQTIKWLEKYFIFPITLFMRAQGDMRKDSIVKTELFGEHIRGKYFVEFTLDDRDQVVDMWRNEFGFTCLQVAPGNF